MCDVKKFSKMYQEIKELQPEDTLQLFMEANDEDSRKSWHFHACARGGKA